MTPTLSPTLFLFLALPAAASASLTSMATMRRVSMRSVRGKITADASVGRREFAATTVAAGVFAPSLFVDAASAAGEKSVVVAGATGKTGSLACRALCAHGGAKVIAGVRNEKKAAGMDLGCASIAHLDVSEDVDKIAAALAGTDSLVCALGFVPGNPLKMNAAAHAVDNVGTCKLVDACEMAGVKKFVLVSSILTDGRAWGQEKSPGFQITNAFGGVLDEKLVAEKHLRASKLDYTIVRPGGLRDEIDGDIMVSGENTLNSGEVSRTSVARVCAEAVFASGSRNKVVEIVEGSSGTPVEKWFA